MAPDGKKPPAIGKVAGTSMAPRLVRRRLKLLYRTRIASRRQSVNRAIRAVFRAVERAGCPVDDRASVEIALREALANAIVHGNRGRDDRRVLLRCYCDPESCIVITIRDEGEGFDPDQVPDPRSASRVLLSHGRGIFLMRELMDHVSHRRGGREVVLYKKVSGHPGETPGRRER